MSTITEKEIRAFVGPNAGYYLSKWNKAWKKTEFNWAAFFLAGLWCPYRKMYRIAALYWGLMLLAQILDGLGLGSRILSYLVKPILAVIFGLYGNRWYWNHTGNEIAQVQSQNLPDEEHLQLLSLRGGTSRVPPVVFFISYILIGVVLYHLFPPPR